MGVLALIFGPGSCQARISDSIILEGREDAEMICPRKDPFYVADFAQGHRYGTLEERGSAYGGSFMQQSLIGSDTLPGSGMAWDSGTKTLSFLTSMKSVYAH